MTPTEPTAYGYIRVTSNRQKHSGVGEEAQRHDIDQAFRGAQGRLPALRWGGHFADLGVSGEKVYLPSRPEGRLLMDLLRPGDLVITHHPDRLARKTLDQLRLLEEFARLKVRLLFTALPDLDPFSLTGELILTVYGAVARMEVENDRRRANARIAAQRQAGQWAGGLVPYGFALHRTAGGAYLVPDAAERQLGHALVTWRMAGHRSADIARHLNGGAYPRDWLKPGRLAAGVEWTEHTVNRYMRFERELAHAERQAGADNRTTFYVPHRGAVRASDFPADLRRYLPTGKTPTTGVAPSPS